MRGIFAELTEIYRKSAQKTAHLKSASEVHQLARKLTELEKWLDSVEAQIDSSDHGLDAASAQALLDAFGVMQAEIAGKKRLLDEAMQRAEKLGEVTPEEQVDTPTAQVRALLARWEALHEPCQIREANLRDAIRFFGWASQADEQLEWLVAKLGPLERYKHKVTCHRKLGTPNSMCSSDYGRSLHSAQSLVQKHQILEQEFAVREPSIANLVVSGERMLGQQGDGARGELVDRLAKLQVLWSLDLDH